MNEYEVLPNISNFILSLRDIGYSLNTAIADILDNSITAKARNIKIYATETPMTICIIDDGCGMDSGVLLEALRLGTKSPQKERETADLGRFGLGLKTASFSQCKKLTVFSKENKISCGYSWDLDYIEQQNKWLLKDAHIEDYKNCEWYEDFITQKSGTVVIWERIDRFDESDFTAVLDDVYNHLSLVFHRFIEGDEIPIMKGDKICKRKIKKIRILLNNRIIEPFNPFFIENDFTQIKVPDSRIINGEFVCITPYILPHHSKVNQKDYDLYATRDGYQKSQGFYLYREGRLLIWGTWFGLHKQCEAHKLIRIKIDINNKIDNLWKIDVKKSVASPAPQIKDWLRKIIRNFTEQAYRVYVQRGTLVDKKNKIIKFWDVKHSNGQIKYILNKNHPSYLLLKDSLSEQSFELLDNYLQFIEEYIPIDAIIAKMMDNPKEIKQKDLKISEQDIVKFINNLQSQNISNDFIFTMLSNIEAYKEYIEFIQKYIYKD